MTEQALKPHYTWHEQQWAHLAELREQRRLPHALLFAGPAGVGKERFAKAFAYGLLCEKAVHGSACRECKACHLNESANPDFKIIEPEEGARQIKVDQLRAVVDYMAQTSHAGGYKITMIRPAEAMNTNAANALLKNLEEPTSNSIIILISDTPGNLLPTIRSRCQQVYFPVPQQQEVLAWLTSATANKDLATQLLEAAGGKPLLALDYLNTGAIQKFKQMEQQFLAVPAGKLTVLQLAEKWKDHELLEILSWLQQALSQLIRASQAGVEITPAWLPFKSVAVISLFSLLDELQQLILKINRGANPNRQLVIEALLLRCQQTLIIQ